MIRKATTEDLPRILEVYAAARQYMRDHGNTVQWGGKDRPESKLENDIRVGQLYVLEDTEIRAVFAFIIGPDATYEVIEGGAWRSDALYGTLHRLGSDGTRKDVFGEVFAWMTSQIGYIRVDTHESNLTMQHIAEKYGFVRCGIIYVPDGTPRYAYDWM